jgi:hypothetical protein
MPYNSGSGGHTPPLPEVNFLMAEIPLGDGDDSGPQLLGHLICLFTLIINIYGLGVGISTIIKFTSCRGGV